MKIKDGFILRKIAGSHVVVAVGKAAENFKLFLYLYKIFVFVVLFKNKSN